MTTQGEHTGQRPGAWGSAGAGRGRPIFFPGNVPCDYPVQSDPVQSQGAQALVFPATTHNQEPAIETAPLQEAVKWIL